MPFQCCTGSNERDVIEIEESNPTKIPKIMNLNEGYCNNLELLIFNKKSKVNQLKNTNKNLEPKIVNFPNFCESTRNIPITYLETKISNFSNNNNAPTLTQASSNVVISGCSSPIKILTTIGNPDELQKASNVQFSPFLNESIKKDDCRNYIITNEQTTFFDTNDHMSNTECELDTNGNKSCDLKNNNNSDLYEMNCEKDKFVLEQKINDNQKNTELQSQVSDCVDSCLVSNKDITQSNVYNEPIEFDNIKICSDLKEKQTDKKLTIENLDLKDINKSDIFEVRDDVDKLIELSKKLKHENNLINKKKRKTKKTIHIEITFSPKNNNNVIIDAQKTKSSNKNVSPINKVEFETCSPTNIDNRRESFSKNELKTKFPNEENQISHKKNHVEKKIEKEEINNLLQKNEEEYEIKTQKNSDETYKARSKSGEELPTSEEDEDVRTERSSPNKSYQKDIEKIDFFISDGKIDNSEGFKDPEMNFKKNSSSQSLEKGYSISSDKFIPFIDEEMKVTDTLKDSQNKQIPIPVNSKFSLTYENNEKTNTFNLSKETLEKLNGSMPIVNSDPQIAQLFASAQLHIDEINNTRSNNTFKNQTKNEEDPIEAIIEFLKDPTGNKVEIWSTVKAVIDVYEPQIEYAKKELERWTKAKNPQDEDVKENVEYYHNLVDDLQQKIQLADKAKQIILNGSNIEEIKRLLEIEQNYLEGIKEKMNLESSELRNLEEKYLNGNIEYKEKVRSSRIKIKEYEDEIRDKLIEIHKLKDLLKIGGDI